MSATTMEAPTRDRRSADMAGLEPSGLEPATSARAGRRASASATAVVPGRERQQSSPNTNREASSPTGPAHSDALDGRESAVLNSSKRRMPDSLRRFLLRVQGGKLYLPAAYRMVWFRDECPDWGVETQLLEGGQEAGFAMVQARIYNSEGRLIASGIKTETRQDFPAGWVEKAETGSIARALAVAGFGTQFAPEMDELTEGDTVHRPADSPQGRPASSAGRVGYERSSYDTPDRTQQTRQRAAASPTEIWNGPGQCPRCHAPEGKRHGKLCAG